jgi:hypothetical protein
MTDQTKEPSITVGGKNYLLSTLPHDLNDLIAVYQVWENELTVQRREVFKLEGAIRSITKELETRFNMLEAQTTDLPQEAQTSAT